MSMSGPVRILHVFGGLDKGGAEGYIMDIYRSVDRSQVQFDFLVHTLERGFYEPEIEALGGTIYRGLPRYRVVNIFRAYRKWLGFFAKNPYTCVHIHTYNLAIPILLAAKKSGIQYRVCHAHSTGGTNFLRNMHMRLSRPFLRNLATHKLAISDLAGRAVFGKGYTVKGSACSIENFRYDAAKRDAKRQARGLENSFVLGHVGRFHKVKNHRFLLEVFSLVSRHISNARLLLVGDGEFRTQIEKKIAKMDLSDKVILLGVRDDVPDLLQAFDLFLMPSLFEGLGLAAVEAQAAGLPCLLSDAVPLEANVIENLVTYLPINKGAGVWAETIEFLHDKPLSRKDTFDEMRVSGCDLKDATEWYEEFYSMMARKGR